MRNAHAEIFVESLVRASSDCGTRNGTQAYHVVKQGNLYGLKDDLRWDSRLVHAIVVGWNSWYVHPTVGGTRGVIYQVSGILESRELWD